MRAAAFENWASVRGGLKANSAESYVDYLTAVENDYRIDLDVEWNGDTLGRVRLRLRSDTALNPGTRRNRLSALSKYEAFCSATSN